MKKLIAATSILLALFALAACTGKPAAAYRVGLVTDTGGIDDKSFNQGTWEGVKLFASENKLAVNKDVKYSQSSAEADYIPNLSTFADEGMNLIVAPGFLFGSAIAKVAARYPEVHFLAIDTVVTTPAEKDASGNDVAGTGGTPFPNVASAIFAEHEGSFLVGVAAGLKAKADGFDTVGYVGGIQFASIEKFEAGYRQGIKAVYPECKVLYDYAGFFDKPDIGQALAQKQYNAGAYIIFQVAGGTGNGVIKEAKERSLKAKDKGQLAWAIGVDKDQYADGVYDGKASAILTSMVKRVDMIAHDAAQMGKDGKFPGGQTIVLNLKNAGVGIPDENPNLTPEMLKIINDYAQQIKDGKLVVSEIPAR